MAQSDFSLNQRDRQRIFKDRFIRIAVKCGGVAVLGALVLIFVYLASVVIPLFSGAKFHSQVIHQALPIAHVKRIAIDDYGKHLFALNDDGMAQFWSLGTKSQQPEFSQQLMMPISQIATMPSDYGWFALRDPSNHVVIAKPQFKYQITSNTRQFKPYLTQYNYQLAPADSEVNNFTFVVTGDEVTFASYLADKSVLLRWGTKGDSQLIHQYRFPSLFDHLDQLLMTPDGKTLYLRNGNDLIVSERKKDRFVVREIIDLAEKHPKEKVANIRLLAGAYSLLVRYQNDTVSQWFDVLNNGQRSLQEIRQFQLAKQTQFLLPDTYRKGFYSFHRDGTVQDHYTTSHKTVFSKKVFSKAPLLAAMSDNERYVLTWNGQQFAVSEMTNDYPEVSISSLWEKVWYEHYPEPQYVWQSTSASDKFEAKFSLVPIAFGTLKAAFYAMLFAVPIAVFGAIYTAYFMTPKMRRIVKPTVELMEALPTVIIGFLAGLWFAPLVESHLTSVVSLMILLPLSTMVAGFIWTTLPRHWLRKIPSGLHVIILMPVIVLVIAVVMNYNQQIEAWLFGGDVRVFLVQHGIDFDQRNALVVGFAMGFAVIPMIFTIAEDAIFSVPKHLSDGSLALGATPWQTLIHVVLLTASPGIFSAIMMGLGRAVGETMIVLMATGNTPIMDWNIFEGMRTLSATIAVELPESEMGSSHFRILFLAALILFIFTFAVNSLAEWVRQRLREKYRAL
ncbi:ABC transporter permease subunit [Vibrio nitrifigilis]|uniref:ABC transporter permease subunit n=1 Tax=Vibrio nitrifigilis TaxID=2789781 RepID=A0ABS0G9T1_9VIBR|nr:ABC transporter permease subunit [Vibrio nitrifigilis]MBF8999162.1 ABC transporter permease subunit [Vibrio nitrifigilis]